MPITLVRAIFPFSFIQTITSFISAVRTLDEKSVSFISERYIFLILSTCFILPMEAILLQSEYAWMEVLLALLHFVEKV